MTENIKHVKEHNNVQNSDVIALKKMGVKESLLFFTPIGLMFFVNFQYILPILKGRGMADLYSALLCMAVPILILLTYVFVKYKRSKMNIKEFLYIKRLTKKEILIALGLFFVVQIFELLLSSSSQLLANLPGYTAPSFYPEIFIPGYSPEFPVSEFLGVELSGKWYVLLVWAVWLVINILGEEVLWRGYALKRMELSFGRWAWLANGLMWNFIVHFFMRWSFITLLPISLILPYICQKTKSIWPGVIIHGLGNLLVYALIIPGVFS